ncbi:MAG: DUF389 domain-containing protein [Gemmatimonadetes bacterium]|nr:DUF389 domain-containing protein [Gemmatimonadota bacterium]
MESDAAVATTVEKVAGERLGVKAWDRPAIFRDVADAAVEADLPYWTVLVLSGAIATLGLAIDSSAVVIGAMLVAPLLAPLTGFTLALAVGDGRLAVQSGTVVVGSALAVVLVAALLTAALPFQTITLEISSRARPTILDLAVAVFSGVVAAVVTLARGHRLSAAIPGVAIAVALIPPLAVGGFAMAAGWRSDLIAGSLLLFGANLAGIVLSGVAVFLLVGMQRPDVVEAARGWHRDTITRGPAGWLTRLPPGRFLDVFGSPSKRILMVAAFTAVVAMPLTESLRQIAREARVRRAVDAAEATFEEPGTVSIVSRRLAFGPDRTQVYLRVATTRWHGPDDRHAFERAASAGAGEPVSLVLEELPVSTGDVDALTDLLQPQESGAPAPPPALPELLALARARVRDAATALPFPPGVRPVGVEIVASEAGELVRVGYLAAEPMGEQANQVLARALAQAMARTALRVEFVHVPAAARRLGAAGATPDSLAALLRRFPALRVELLAGEDVDSTEAATAADALREAGVSGEPPLVQRTPEPGLRVRLAPDERTGPPPLSG